MGGEQVNGTGRRKEAVARVRLKPGSGKVTVNNRPIEDFFPSQSSRMHAVEALRVAEATEKYDISATVDGGGVTGQAGAVRLGIARALCDVDESLRPVLKRAGLLSRDSREKERRKYGLKKARKAPQYSKR